MTLRILRGRADGAPQDDKPMNDRPSVQERYAPRNHCFGCGPANPKGLHVRSFEDGEGLVADWTPEPHHEAVGGADGRTTATCRGVFVAVKEDHPAFHRW